MPVPRLGGGRSATPRSGGGAGWPTILLCLATALVTWSGTTLVGALTDGGAEPDVGAASAGVARVPPSTSAVRHKPHRSPQRGATPHNGARGKTRPVPAQGAVQAPVTVANRRATAIRIPAMGVDQDLVELSVNGSSLQVPDDYFDIGWWRDGPTPGERGAAVMVGHVDSPTRPAVFYGLSGLVAGEQVVVERDDGSRALFRVRETVLYDRDQIPSAKVYRNEGKPGLNLLTCGGSYDQDGGYSGNVVVYTDLVKLLPAPAKAKTKGRGEQDDSSNTDGPWTRERVLGQAPKPGRG